MKRWDLLLVFASAALFAARGNPDVNLALHHRSDTAK